MLCRAHPVRANKTSFNPAPRYASRITRRLTLDQVKKIWAGRPGRSGRAAAARESSSQAIKATDSTAATAEDEEVEGEEEEEEEEEIGEEKEELEGQQVSTITHSDRGAGPVLT